MPDVLSQETTDFQRVLTRHLALPLSVGIVSAAVFLGLILYLLSTLSWVDHTQHVIGNANELTTLTVDLETGTRGFLLTGDEGYLEPYTVAKAKVPGQVAALVDMVSDNPVQVARLRRIQGLEQQWDQIAQERITSRRRGDSSKVLADSQTGKQLFDEIRREFDGFAAAENRLLKERNDAARDTTTAAVVLYVIFIMGLSGLIAWSGRRQIVNMSQTYGSALALQRDATEHLERQAWLRAGQTQLADRLMGEHTLPRVGRSVLDFTAAYLGNVVAALYLRNDTGRLQRVASYGFDASAQSHGQLVGMEEGLVGQVAQDGKTKQVAGVYTDYFKVTSGLGHTAPAHVIVAPVDNNGQTNGVIELGFMRAAGERDLALLELVAGHIGASLDAAENRQRLQQALAETRELNEELQQQQEELRSANEELEEQSTALMSSQANLEHQQAELEQTNSQLAQQAAMLDRRNDALSQAQAEIQQRADELQRASRYKSEFLANMSHELRTPLNSSLILAKLLSENKDGNLNEEQLKFAQIIYSAGNDLLTLINDILDLSKVEAGKLELTPQRVPLARLAESLDSTFAPLARDKQLAFEIELRPDVPDSLVTDSQRTEQVLKNLLSNAIKFTAAGFVRLVIAPQAGHRLSFSVTDTGIGIAADQQAAVFEAFRQADGTINRRYGGTGLGLSISRELAALLGGSIDVVSEPGRGSTFTLSLPQEWQDHRPDAAPLPPPAVQAFTAPFPASQAVRAVPSSAVTSAAEAFASFADDRHDTASTGRLLLVIDDDPEFAAILYGLAHEMGYQCLVAHRAHEGLLLAAEHSPHAILLDIYLPDGSGLSVLQQLKEHPRTRHIPVHIVAAEDVSEVAMPMGAIGFAVKPTTRDQLKAVLGKLEDQVARKVKRVLLVEDDERQRQSVVHLIRDEDIEIEAVERGHQALELLRRTVFDCMIIDLKLPDMDGSELLERMTREDIRAFPPVIVYTGRNLTREEEAGLNRYSRSIIIKGARSPERLLDEVTLFLHKVESQLSAERQGMLKMARSRDKVFEGRKVLLVDDDVRNIFALSSALEQRGLQVEIARNGFEALAKLDGTLDIDLVLMDVMMPGMDGLEATRRIRAIPRLRKLPIIAITAKAMKDDQEQCRAAGMNDYLAKPIDLQRLFSLLRVWMPSMERL